MRRVRGMAVVLSLSTGLAACGSNQPAPAPAASSATPPPAPVVAVEPEARSVTGRPLVPMELPAAERAKFEANLKAAEEELAKNPGSADALIWVGRRQGYLWQYKKHMGRPFRIMMTGAPETEPVTGKLEAVEDDVVVLTDKSGTAVRLAFSGISEARIVLPW